MCPSLTGKVTRLRSSTAFSSQHLFAELVLILIHQWIVSLIAAQQAIAKLVAGVAEVTGHPAAHTYRVLHRIVIIWRRKFRLRDCAIFVWRPFGGSYCINTKSCPWRRGRSIGLKTRIGVCRCRSSREWYFVTAAGTCRQFLGSCAFNRN
jgi:hypothetical protein